MNSVDSGLQKKKDFFPSFLSSFIFLNFLLSIPLPLLSPTIPGGVTAWEKVWIPLKSGSWRKRFWKLGDRGKAAVPPPGLQVFPGSPCRYPDKRGSCTIGNLGKQPGKGL